MINPFSYFALVFCLCFAEVKAFYPIICVPGIFDLPPHKMENVCNEIAKKHDGTKILFLYPGDFLGSLLPMWFQVELYRPLVNNYFKEYSEGIHIIAHSQGTLIMRALIESTCNHPVRNFISINGPFMGFSEIPMLGICTDKSFKCFVAKILNKILKGFATQFFYTSLFQRTISVAGMYHDPVHEDKFLEENTFLPVINNLVKHENAPKYKKNFLRLNRLVLIASSADETIIPYQSEIGGFYSENMTMIPMEMQKMYVDDTFGLRTLDNDDRLERITLEGADHEEIITNMNLVNRFILPHCD